MLTAASAVSCLGVDNHTLPREWRLFHFISGDRSGLVAEFAGQFQGELEILGRAEPNGPLASFGIFNYDIHRNPMRLPVPTRLASFRVEHRQSSGGNAGELARLRIFAIESSRTFSIDGNEWFLTRPETGAWTSIAFTIRATAQDNFGLLFMSVGSPLSSAPILLMPTARGGLLLDPANLSLVDAEPWNGVGAWPFVVSFPFDPAVLSMPIHLQAVLGDVFTNPINNQAGRARHEHPQALLRCTRA